MIRKRIDWNGTHNIVVVDNTTNSGHIEMTLEEFVRLADWVITETFEPTNPGFKKSFKLLPSRCG